MTDRPMLMRPNLVLRTIAGAKDITRRPAKREITDLLDAGMTDDFVRDPGNVGLCPYGVVGDRLWIREPFRLSRWWTREDDPARVCAATVAYRADNSEREVSGIDIPLRKKSGWTPSIHMWRWASRLLLTIESVRLERLQEITADDVAREGLVVPDVDYMVPEHPEQLDAERQAFARKLFGATWDGIYTPPCRWADNPYVWRIAYKPERLK